MLGFEVSVRNRLWRASQSVKEAVGRFITTEDGDTNIVSIIVVLGIVLALAIFFRDQLKALVTTMWGTVTQNAEDATSTW